MPTRIDRAGGSCRRGHVTFFRRAECHDSGSGNGVVVDAAVAWHWVDDVLLVVMVLVVSIIPVVFVVLLAEEGETQQAKPLRGPMSKGLQHHQTNDYSITKQRINVYVHTMVEPPLPISNREVKHHLAELVLR